MTCAWVPPHPTPGNIGALGARPRGREGIVHSAKVLLLRFQCHLCPGPRLLLYWNRFIQCGNFVTFLVEGNFLFSTSER